MDSEWIPFQFVEFLLSDCREWAASPLFAIALIAWIVGGGGVAYRQTFARDTWPYQFYLRVSEPFLETFQTINTPYRLRLCRRSDKHREQLNGISDNKYWQLHIAFV